MLDGLLNRVRFTSWRGNLEGRATLWVRSILSAFGRRLDLHAIVAADDQHCFHSHPAFALRIILAGGYIEELSDGQRRQWRPGMVGLIRPTDVHRIDEVTNGRVSYSLWIRGRKRARVRLIGSGWPEHLRGADV